MTYKTIKCVSVPNLKSFEVKKKELRAKEVGEFSIMLYGKMGWWRSLAHQTWLPRNKCMGIFKTFNSRNFCIYWCIDLKHAEVFQNGIIHIL